MLILVPDLLGILLVVLILIDITPRRPSQGDAPIEAAVTITSFLGLRRSEVLGLKWSAININTKTLIIQTTVVRTKKIIEKDTTKNKSSHRTLPIPDGLVQYMTGLLSRQNHRQVYLIITRSCLQITACLISGSMISGIHARHFF